MYLTGIVSYLVAWLILGQDSRDQLTKESSMDFMVINNIHMILVLPLTITIPLLFLSLLVLSSCIASCSFSWDTEYQGVSKLSACGWWAHVHLGLSRETTLSFLCLSVNLLNCSSDFCPSIGDNPDLDRIRTDLLCHFPFWNQRTFRRFREKEAVYINCRLYGKFWKTSRRNVAINAID